MMRFLLSSHEDMKHSKYILDGENIHTWLFFIVLFIKLAFANFVFFLHYLIQRILAGWAKRND